MRNLKRMLCLALTVVMLVGMMVVGAGAAGIDGFVDKDEIKHKEAVALLVELGVLEGNNDGKFYPNGSFTREQMAKIAYLLSNINKEFELYEGSSTLGDISGRWSEGAIAWCNTSENQILTGTPDGNFWPNGKLMVRECAAILLRVLGYNNTLSGIDGSRSGWEVRAMNLARDVGLLKGLDTLKSGDIISRDDACLMAYNALFLPTVTFKTKYDATTNQMIPTDYVMDGDDIKACDPKITEIFKAEKKTGMVTGIDDKGNAVVNGTAVKGLAATPDMIGSTVSYFVQGTDSTVLASATTTASSVMGTSTDGTALSALTAKTNAKFIAEVNADVAEDKDDKGNVTTAAVVGTKYFLNGVQQAADSLGALETAVAKAGVVVEFINNDADAYADAVKVTEKKVSKLSADPVATTKNDVTTVTIKGSNASANVTNANAKTLSGWEGLKKDDVVLISKVAGITTFEKPESVTGTVSGIHSTKGALIGGSYYKASGLNGTTYSANTCNNSKEWNFYLDDNGSIAYAVAVSTGDEQQAPEKETGYLVIDDTTWVKSVTTGSFDDELSGHIDAKVIFFDGTKATVTIDSVDGIKAVRENVALKNLGKYVDNTSGTNDRGGALDVEKTAVTHTVDEYKVVAGQYYVVGTKSGNATGQSLSIYLGVSDTPANATTNLATLITLTQNGGNSRAVYAYTKNSDGHYSLTTLETAAHASNTGKITSGAITSGKAQFHSTDIADAKTVFLFAVTDADDVETFTTYTGYANIPGVTATYAKGEIVKNGAVASHVYVQVGDSTKTTSAVGAAKGDLMYVLTTTDYTKIGSGASAYIETTQLLNGVETKMKLAGTTVMAELAAGSVYSVTEKDGVWTVGSPKTAVTGIQANKGGVLLDNTGTTAYTYADDTPAYIVELDGTITETTVDQLAVDANDEVIIDHDNTDAKLINVVYVNKVTNEPKAPAFITASGTTAKVSVNPADGTTVKSVTVDGIELQKTTGSEGTFTGDVENLGATATVVITVEDVNSEAKEDFAYTLTVVKDSATEVAKVSIGSVAATFAAEEAASKTDNATYVALSGAAHIAQGAKINVVDGEDVLFIESDFSKADREFAIYKIVLPDTYKSSDYKFSLISGTKRTGDAYIGNTDGENHDSVDWSKAKSLDASHTVYVIVSNTITDLQIAVSNDSGSTMHYFNFTCDNWKISK